MTTRQHLVICAIGIVFPESASPIYQDHCEGFVGLYRACEREGVESPVEEVQGDCGNSFKGQLTKVKGRRSESGD